MPRKPDPNKPKRPPGRPKADPGQSRYPEETWAKIRASYCAGEASLGELAKVHGVPPATVERRARREVWTVARTERMRRIQELAQERLTGLTPAPEPERASDPMTVAVETKVAVVLAHRKLIARIRGVVNDLLEVTEYQVAEVRARVEKVEPEDRGVMALTQLAETKAVGENLRTLTNTTSQLVTMEREAFGISPEDGAKREETYEERLKRLLEQSKAK